MASLVPWPPEDEYERLRAENRAEAEAEREDLRQREAMAAEAAAANRKARERRQFDRDCAFYDQHIEALTAVPSSAQPDPGPTREETDKLNRLYWYNLMFR